MSEIVPSIKGQWIQSKSEHLTKHSWPSNNNYIHYVLKSKFEYCDSLVFFCASKNPSKSPTRRLWSWKIAEVVCSKSRNCYWNFLKIPTGKNSDSRSLTEFIKNSATICSTDKVPIREVEEYQRKCHLCQLYQVAAFHLWYFSTFAFGLLLEKQTVAEFLKNFSWK